MAEEAGERRASFERRPALTVPGTSGQPAVITPNGVSMPWKIIDGVKVGHLVAMPIEHAFAEPLRVKCFGYNGRTPGPTLELVEGDRMRMYVTNQLGEPTTVHWHGVVLPNGMDGVAGLNQAPIPPGRTFAYEFTFQRPGTFMYHPHFDEMTQIGSGLMGMIVVHPKRSSEPTPTRDYVLMTHEWRVDVGTARPNPSEMTDFNVLTFNSKVFPATEPLLAGLGERLRIRLGNLSPLDHHPIHVHGVSFTVTETDGGRVPVSARFPETTVIVPVGGVRVVEMTFDQPGDWAMHCHMTHHIMTQMGHDLPLMIGADPKPIDRWIKPLVPGFMTMGHEGMAMAGMDMPSPRNSAAMLGGAGPFGHIDMGGMMTVVKVRPEPEAADPNGWWEHPSGSVAKEADPGRVRADGFDPDQSDF